MKKILLASFFIIGAIQFSQAQLQFGVKAGVNYNSDSFEDVSEDVLNCEHEGVLGTIAGVVGTLQANEVLKQILNIGKSLDNQILILDLLNLNFRKVKIKKQKKCIC